MDKVKKEITYIQLFSWFLLELVEWTLCRRAVLLFFSSLNLTVTSNHMHIVCPLPVPNITSLVFVANYTLIFYLYNYSIRNE